MKDLRQLVRRSGLLASGKRRRRALDSRRADAMNRRLRSETLEKRNLLAGGILASQNFNPYDVNDDGMISVRDALGVVNFLARGQGAEGEQGGLTSSSNGAPNFHYDVNGDSEITASDALGVINALARAEGAPSVTPIELELTEDDSPTVFNLLQGQAAMSGTLSGVLLKEITIDGDINVVTNDALFFLNGYNPGAPLPQTLTADESSSGFPQVRGQVLPEVFSELNDGESSTITIVYDVVESSGDSSENTATIVIEGVTDKEVEYLLTVRDLDDKEIAPVNGVVSVGVDQEVYLQVAYEDLRSASLGTDIGAFQLITNLTFDNASLITPVLYESQKVELTGSFSSSRNGVRFSIPDPAPVENPGPQVYEKLAGQLEGKNLAALLAEALELFGYDPSQYRMDGDGNAQRVTFIGLGNQNVPDITFDVLDSSGNPDEGGFVSGEVTVTPALLPDGSPNSDAVPYSIDFRSNSFDSSPDGFGEAFYKILLSGDGGSYDPNAGGENQGGFIAVGGLGGIPGQGGGIPELGEFGEPFDSFSLKVKVNAPEVDVMASIEAASAENEFLLLYGYDNQRIADNVLAETVEGGLGQELGNANNGVATLTLSTKTPNELPIVTEEVAATFVETDPEGSVDLLQFASDPDGDDAGLSVAGLTLESGNGSGITQNGNTLTVDPSSYRFLNDNETEVVVYNYDVVDVRGGTVAQKATITITGVTDPNLRPSIELDQSFTIPENTTAPTPVGTVVASDPDEGDTLTFSIVSGNNGDAFEIDSLTGELRVKTNSAIDFEVNPKFDLGIQVADNGGLTDTQTVTVNLTDINEAPVINDQSFSVNETAPQGTVFGMIAATDPEGAGLTFTVTAGDNGEIISVSDTGELSVATDQLVPETQVVFTVQVSDGTNAASAVITVNVTDVPQPPTVNDQTFDVDENSPVDTVVGKVVANDPDGDPLTYVITDGNAAGKFGIDANTGDITVAGSLDFETEQTYLLTVRVSDPGNLNATATITINVNDLNEAPTVEDQVFSVAENVPSGTVVGTIEATDTDPDGTSLTYTVTGGSGDGVFSVDSESGQVTTVGSLDFEMTNQYGLDITVSDGELSDTALITINVTNVNEAPIAGDPIEATFNEQDTPGLVNLLAGSSDPDGDDLSVAELNVVNGNAGGITQVGNSLQVDPTFYGYLLDGEIETVNYSFLIKDPAGLSVAQTATIMIIGFNAPPNAGDINRNAVVDQVVVINVLENNDAGDGEGDTDSISLQSAELTSASENVEDFSFNPATGEVAITPASDFEGEVTFTYTIVDQQGKTASASGRVNYLRFVPSTISGLVFEDHLENGIDVAMNGAEEIRNGVKDIDEVGFAGLVVELFSAASENVTGEEIRMTTQTDITGAYGFDSLPPGNFHLKLVDPPGVDLIGDDDHVVMSRENEGGVLKVTQIAQSVKIGGPLGGQDIVGIDWHVVSKGRALDTNNLLSSNYDNLDENGNPRGAFALLDIDGKQVFVGVTGGFAGVDMVTVTYDKANDEALLEILDEGQVQQRILAQDEYELSEGDKIQIFGGLDDLFPGSDDDDGSLLSSS
ncbi:MAG: cadherin domain-containing protein [Rubripirellula sp.]|nr:cadherin domain-containing protein [Rubripirellula sp.]